MTVFSPDTVFSSDIVLTVVGSGTCVPSLRRSSCSVLVETGSRRLLFDAGPGTMRRLLELGIEIFDLDMIFFSHFHPDHSGELVPLLFSSKYPAPSRRRNPLYIAGGTGFKNFFTGLKAVYGDWIELSPGLLALDEFDTRGPDSRDFKTFQVATRPVNHRPESIGFRVDTPTGCSAVYSGDTDVCDTLADLAAGADLFVCESALPEGFKVPGHLTPAQAGAIAARAHVRKLVLTHFYPACDQTDMVQECRRTYSGPLVLAEDGMRFTLSSK